MNKLFIGSFIFYLLFASLKTEAAMYDKNGNRVFGRQNHMRHGTYDPRVPYRQFKTKRISVQKKLKRSLRTKRKYIRCDLPQNKKLNYKFNLLRFKLGAHRQCQEDVRYILNIPYKTKTKRYLRPYEWKSKGY